MESKVNAALGKLAYNINLAYELLSRVEAGESIKGLMAGLSGPFPSAREDYKKFAKTQDDFTQKWVIGEPKYKDAISTLEKEFGHIDSVQNILKQVYQKCPTLKPQAPSSHAESVT